MKYSFFQPAQIRPIDAVIPHVPAGVYIAGGEAEQVVARPLTIGEQEAVFAKEQTGGRVESQTGEGERTLIGAIALIGDVSERIVAQRIDNHPAVVQHLSHRSKPIGQQPVGPSAGAIGPSASTIPSPRSRIRAGFANSGKITSRFHGPFSVELLKIIDVEMIADPSDRCQEENLIFGLGS